jgi:queuine tRNA-ribosyltransferase
MDMGFDGYGYGGWPITEGNQLEDTLEFVAQILPASKPKYALGIGKPENIVKCVKMGYSLFDCVIPTRDARRGRIYVFSENPETSSLDDLDFYKYLYMRDKKHIDDPRPIDEKCDCLCCRNYSRAYLHHLFRIGDTLAYRLATIHNLRFYTQLMENLRLRAINDPE